MDKQQQPMMTVGELRGWHFDLARWGRRHEADAQRSEDAIACREEAERHEAALVLLDALNEPGDADDLNLCAAVLEGMATGMRGTFTGALDKPAQILDATAQTLRLAAARENALRLEIADATFIVAACREELGHMINAGHLVISSSYPMTKRWLEGHKPGGDWAGMMPTAAHREAIHFLRLELEEARGLLEAIVPQHAPYCDRETCVECGPWRRGEAWLTAHPRPADDETKEGTEQA